jgi:phosphohistidine phosphatase SixA/8-oxo-dGTP pyrophosphatase MutT (NUDIX family)
MARGVEEAVAQEVALLDVSSDTVVRAAGGIVTLPEGEEPRFALVHRPKYDDWTFPKGKLHDGESEEQAALREVEEETGLRCRLEEPVDEVVAYTDRLGRPKVVRYWTMTPDGGAFRPNDEVDELRWVGAEEAMTLLTYPHDRDLLRSVLARRTRSPVYVVRHAKAGDRERWKAPDDERPLTEEGRRQADHLVERFEGSEVERIVSSPFLRCIQTVQPLARSRGLEVEIADELAEGADPERTIGFIRRLEPVPTVLCGHGGEIAAVLQAFEAAGAKVEGSRGLAKGSVWVLEREGGRVVSARYLPAPKG